MQKLDLSPAKWIWLPSQRTVTNTFVDFRRTFSVKGQIRKAEALIFADSRYVLHVNGRRAAFGPAPSDPRFQEVDCLDLSPYLQEGENVIAIRALYYGSGDGTWVCGHPGLLFKAEVQDDVQAQTICSDASFRCRLDKTHRPAGAKRWFLRALYEQYDASQETAGWDQPGYDDSGWFDAMEIPGSPAHASVCTGYGDYAAMTMAAHPEETYLFRREMPLMAETSFPASEMVHGDTLQWHTDPDDWFLYRMPGSFTLTPGLAVETRNNTYRFAMPEGMGAALTFAFSEEAVGFPYFTIEAPEGTVVDILFQESHDPDKTHWLDTSFFAFSQMTCGRGESRFLSYDYESIRFMQLHIRPISRPAPVQITIKNVGMLRRTYPFAHEPVFSCSDEKLEKVYQAGINTLRNCAQDILVDGMGRERQQYGGDGSRQLTAVQYAFGPAKNADRLIRTFGKGLAKDGYFMDSWPAWDRMARIPLKEFDLTDWGPILDHGVGFILDCWQHYMLTGERDAVAEVFPNLAAFVRHLAGLLDENGLVKVSDIGVTCVWIDHQAYTMQRHKQCTFNLYIAAMLRHAFVPLCDLCGTAEEKAWALSLADALLAKTTARFWDGETRTFVDNLPWLTEEGERRYSDRTLSTAVIFDLCPGGEQMPSARILASCPANMGLSYPCNADWRLWAMCKAGMAGEVMDELRTRWFSMASVGENNSLQEYWVSATDSPEEWSHSPTSPVSMPYTGFAGIIPTAPAFRRFYIRPQLGDLERMALTTYTPFGEIRFAGEQAAGGCLYHITVPAGTEADLVLPEENSVSLPPADTVYFPGTHTYKLPAGEHRLDVQGKRL